MVREFAVVGLGRFGSGVALGLAKAGCTVVGIDHDREVVQALAEQLSDVIEANACDENALRLIGIGDFDAVVVAIGELENSLLTTVALKHLGVRPRQYQRTRDCRRAQLAFTSTVDVAYQAHIEYLDAANCNRHSIGLFY